MSDYWYKNQDELSPGDVFLCEDYYGFGYTGAVFVKLDRRVPGDGTDWYVLDWVQKFSTGYWTDNDSRIHPGDLKERAKYTDGWYESQTSTTQEESSVAKGS